jgi:hypothetical protein
MATAPANPCHANYCNQFDWREDDKSKIGWYCVVHNRRFEPRTKPPPYMKTPEEIMEYELLERLRLQGQLNYTARQLDTPLTEEFEIHEAKKGHK